MPTKDGGGGRVGWLVGWRRVLHICKKKKKLLAFDVKEKNNNAAEK